MFVCPRLGAPAFFMRKRIRGSCSSDNAAAPCALARRIRFRVPQLHAVTSRIVSPDAFGRVRAHLM